MRYRNGIRWIVLLTAILWVIPGALADNPWAARQIGWKLTGARVVDPGKTTTSQEGILLQGFTIEAAARARAGNTVPDGIFRIVLSAFNPQRDMPGQKAGVWHIQGQWTITSRTASLPEKTARYSPAVIKGRLQARLPFNPAAGTREMAASVSLPTAPTAGRWMRGGVGIYRGNSLFEGMLMLNSQVGIDLKGRKP